MGAPIGQGTILVVDDEPEVLEVLREYLTDQGYRVITATKMGWRPSSKSRGGPPRRLSSTLFVPRLGGLGALDRIRGLDPEITIILISGAPNVLEMVTEAGVSVAGAFPKPLDLPGILGTLVEAGLMPSRAPGAAAPRAAKQGGSRGRRRVLMVDDEADVREMLIECLAGKGFEARGASDGQEALRLIPDFRPHICVHCFNDKRLIEWIKEEGKRGNCSWCGARRTYVVHLTDLGPLFRDVAEIYVPSDNSHGDWISDLLQQDWDIFSERLLEKYDCRIQDLVVAILVGDLDPKEASAGTDYSGLFRSTNPFHTTLEEEWETRVAQLLGEKTPLDEAMAADKEDFPDPLEYTLSEAGISCPTDTILFRARTYLPSYGPNRFSPSDLGAPPAAKTRSQRANRSGEPVLYTASDVQTALAEVRTWKGAVVGVGRMRIGKDVSILDLREPTRIGSPFFEEFLKWRIEANGLLERFGLELARPIVPEEPEAQYARTQHLCDLVRKAGYGGIAYPSAMGPGYNVVLFDPVTATVTDIEYFKIRGIQFTSEEIQAEKIYFDEYEP